MRSAGTAVLILAALAVSAPTSGEWDWPPSDEVGELARANLDRHFESEALTLYLNDAPEDERSALEFLLAWLPPPDLGAAPADLLIENTELAIESWREASWHDEVDAYVFHTYVLPHRVSQEPIQRWRPRLRDLILPRIEGLNLEEAALEVNRFCREWATYRPSSRRDQGPLTTMERGIGRCEEEMIFAICALRSVGIPARACSAPWWTVSDGNHAWTEVYTGRELGWRYLGACEPAACLDQAWFSKAAARTAIVLSVGYGEAPAPDEYADRVYRQSRGVTILNSVDVYGDPGTLAVNLPAGVTARDPDAATGEAPAAPDDEEARRAYVHVINYAGPMAIAGVAPGDLILLGPGDYLVTTEIDGMPYSGVAAVASEQTTRLVLEAGLAALDAPIWLRYPPGDEDAGNRCAIEEDDPVWLRHRAAVAERELDRCRRSLPEPRWSDWVAGRRESGALHERTEWAGPRLGAWAEAVFDLNDELRGDAADFLARLDLKDLHEIDPAGLEQALSEVARVRVLAPAVPDSLWSKFVLSSRLYFQAGSLAWRTELPWLGESSEERPNTEEILSAFRRHVDEIDATYAGHVALPEDTWRSGVASPPSARACLVALMRRHGVPARAEMGVDHIEAWSDGAWERLVPFVENSTDSGGAVDAGTAPFDPPEPARLTVEYFDLGQVLENVETWRQTRLARFEGGRFEPWYAGQLSEGDGVVEWSLEPGEYWLFGGLRNPRGEPRFVSKRVTLAAGDSMRVSMDVGIPLAEWEPRDLVSREWDEAWDIELERDGEIFPLSALEPRRKLLVVTMSGHEASTRHLPPFEEIDWQKLGVAFVPVRVSGLPDHPPEPDALMLDAALLQDPLGVARPESELPLTILTDSDGETLVWLEGMRPELAEHIRTTMVGR